ncbi:MAG TPA: efflux RND transporter periplasmic adaptor subunit [Gemmatimonadaceae bacterium]|nr:efflux RND transporter periplasmic adaptor subunit [Gemmatimonadaceae bacterium]
MRRPIPLSLALTFTFATVACRAAPSGAIEATGSLELTEVDVAPLTPARVVTVLRNEGDRVRVGDTLLTLSQSTLPSEIAAQQAAVDRADAQLRDLRAGARPAEIAQAEAQASAAEADATRAAQDLARLTPLAANGTVSAQQLDAARAVARSAAERRDAARQTVRLLRQGARPDQVRAADASLAAARASLAAARQQATDLVLVAPIAGTVLSRNAEPGEVLPAGMSGMTLGDPARPYVRIYVDENAFPRIHVGDTASVFLDAFPDRAFRGDVVAVSDRAEFTPRVALTKDERADLMFGVKIQLVDTSTVLKAGLPVTVRLAPHAGR